MQRTIRLKLAPTPAQAAVLRATLAQHTACFNAVTTHGWPARLTNGVQLHHATYYPLRARHPTLPAQLVCAARVRATEALKSAVARERQGQKAHCPHSERLPIRYDAHSYHLAADRQSVSLATVQGRQHIALAPSGYAADQLSRAVTFDSADLLVDCHGRFWLHVVVTVPAAPHLPTGVVVGVDLGLAYPAVTSNNRFFGPRRWREVDRRYFRLRRQLQAKGTPSAKRHLRRLSGNEARFRRDCDHVLSKRIVQSVAPGTVLAVEHLTDIRTRTQQRGREARRRFHTWSFAQLRSFLTYKAEAHGCRVVGVDSRHTSQTCSRCGHQDPSSRRSQAVFRCRACGYELPADLNGARNIAARCHAALGKTEGGGPPVNRPIVRASALHGVTHKLPASAGSR